MRQVLPAALVCFLGLVIPAAVAAAPARTTLTISARDGSGSPVRIVRAEVVFDIWGSLDRLPLSPTDRGTVEVPLDSESWSERWPYWQYQFHVDARIIVEPADSVVTVSLPFRWLGMVPDHGKDRVSSVDVRFPGSDAVSVSRGDSKALTIRARRPAERRLRFVDQDGAPVRGVVADVFFFLANSNHCGAIEGDRLAMVTGNDDGIAEIPDGDFEYAVGIRKPFFYMAKESMPSGASDSVLGYLQATTCTVNLLRLPEREIDVRVRSGGRPVPGIVLSDSISHCCAGCSGPIGTSDSHGRIQVRHFHAGFIEKLFIQAPSGDVIWQIDVKEIEGKPRLDIDLPSRTAPPRPGVR